MISRQVFTKPTASRGLKPAYRPKHSKLIVGLPTKIAMIKDAIANIAKRRVG